MTDDNSPIDMTGGEIAAPNAWVAPNAEATDKYGDTVFFFLSPDRTLLRIETTDAIRGSSAVYQGTARDLMPQLRELVAEWYRATGGER